MTNTSSKLKSKLEPCPDCGGTGVHYDGHEFVDCILCYATGQVTYSEGEEDDNYNDY